MPLDPRITGHKNYNPNADRYLQKLTVEQALSLLNHEKTTPENLWHVAQTAATHGPGAILPLLNHKKTTLGNLGFVARAARDHGREATLASWSHEKTTPENLKLVVRAAAKHGPGATLAAWSHKKTTTKNLTEVAEEFASQAKNLQTEGISQETAHALQRELIKRGHMPTTHLLRELHRARQRKPRR